jgi:hypothetical protein
MKTLETDPYSKPRDFQRRSREVRAVMLVGFLVSSQPLIAMSAPPNTNFDEKQVPPYTLPDALLGSAGRRITTLREWQSQRRPEILKLFETNVYGRSPQPPKLQFDVVSESDNALNGRAIRKQVAIHLMPHSARITLHLLLYLPKTADTSPVFLGLNFGGNHAVHGDPEIALSTAWMRDTDKPGVVNNRATDASRGTEAERWQIEQVVDRGFGVATMYYGDIDPDFDDGFQNGVHALFHRDDSQERPSDAWGSIAAWAWGLSRAMDYLVTDPQVDPKRVAVWGHSRLGKTALWAAATDERFALAISNNSGCGGAALSRRIFGETVAHINKSFPHWFCRTFHRYNNREHALPVDQHMLIACIAPRPVYVASAVEDRWADPRGEFLAAKAAAPVYDLLLGPTAAALPDDMPPLNTRVGKYIGYHIRAGEHDATAYDWQQYLDFAERHFHKGDPAP